MLVLSRKEGEGLLIGANVKVTVVSLSPGQVRIAIDAPEDVTIYREEVYERIARANREAAGISDSREEEPAASQKRRARSGKRGRRKRNE